ncbi:DUF3408 domain-containing protein [Bacteroidales bacterium OttesenSCG-928-K03]|nr:DUF3408 domain-containing protein [Bacteroidales bacterium OttesenSCG-928-L14]MDL2240181.1 DUF3408 domain-containing protein [Bacteroidales bacterium OttesenSCG-928-K22]MDL2242464.1 DUF3408 domain-containing protein [Bacteroidales bacterium OttesenSCG-928-K03]
MAKQNIEIDEDFMKEIISQGLPSKANIVKETTAKETSPEESAGEESNKAESKSLKKKKNIQQDYCEMFFKKVEIADRRPMYVDRITHEKLIKIVGVIGGRKATLSSYVENIIKKHFEQYIDDINSLYQSQIEKPL